MVPFNQAVKFGLITGMALIAYVVVLYVTNMDLFSPVFSILNGLITFGIMIFMAVFTINKTRDLHLEGKITFLQAWLAGAVMLVITMILQNLFNYLLNAVIDPSYMAAQLDGMIANMEGKVPEETLEGIIESVEENLDPLKNLVKSTWLSPLVALVLSAIISIFIKKDTTIQA